ncbi:PadR family transcriptional regulator [Leucobacter weissii]|uniref:PadR family transcriptional regulator n=1 Tax=Leucobacter weissii TaxID=1983706 RepID=A0A939S708_9MICO|nr:PadR family transcriptional regulator [Leucobacter weissii]MBO1900461.1 PadR family transcriptional regulator [Leucobacter weissii]
MEATQLLKGVLDAAVLAIVQGDDGYGYDVVRRLREAGLEEVGDASVYGTLRRLYASGALSTYVVPSEDGPHRKYYSITPSGSEHLEQQRRDWQRFSATIAALLAPHPGTAAPRTIAAKGTEA